MKTPVEINNEMIPSAKLHEAHTRGVVKVEA